MFNFTFYFIISIPRKFYTHSCSVLYTRTFEATSKVKSIKWNWGLFRSAKAFVGVNGKCFDDFGYVLKTIQIIIDRQIHTSHVPELSNLIHMSLGPFKNNESKVKILLYYIFKIDLTENPSRDLCKNRAIRPQMWLKHRYK